LGGYQTNAKSDTPQELDNSIRWKQSCTMCSFCQISYLDYVEWHSLSKLNCPCYKKQPQHCERWKWRHTDLTALWEVVMRQKDIDLLQFQDPTTSLQVQSYYTPWCLNPRVQDTSPLHNRTKFLSIATLEIQYETKLCAPGLNVRSCSRSTRDNTPMERSELSNSDNEIACCNSATNFSLDFRRYLPTTNCVSPQWVLWTSKRKSDDDYPASLRGFNTGVLGINKEARVLRCMLLLIMMAAWRSNLVLDLSVSCTRIVVRHRDSSNSAIPISDFHFLEVLKFRKLWHDWKKMQLVPCLIIYTFALGWQKFDANLFSWHRWWFITWKMRVDGGVFFCVCLRFRMKYRENSIAPNSVPDYNLLRPCVTMHNLQVSE